MNNKIIKNIIKTILIISLFLCIALTNGKERILSPIENFVSFIINIPQRGFIRIYKNAINDEEYLKEIEELYEANNALKEENKTLKRQLAELDIIKEQNKKIINNSKINSHFDSYKIVSAEVIANSNNNWEKTFVIDKGTKDGIKPKMCVVTNDGLVGFIYSCKDNTSTIVSILDSTSQISSRAKDSREEVLIKGSLEYANDDVVVASFLPIDVEFKSGDVFETSGIGGLYPKGIKIGSCLEFLKSENNLENKMLIKTFVDFKRLETVAVLIND